MYASAFRIGRIGMIEHFPGVHQDDLGTSPKLPVRPSHVPMLNLQLHLQLMENVGSVEPTHSAGPRDKTTRSWVWAKNVLEGSNLAPAGDADELKHEEGKCHSDAPRTELETGV